VLQAIHELTYWRLVPAFNSDGERSAKYVRHWADEIVSPARRLFAYVRDLDALARNQQE
jgi:hypothetical protein